MWSKAPTCADGVHRFEARFDEERPIDIKASSGGWVNYSGALPKRIYVRDICVRCGKTIEREANRD